MAKKVLAKFEQDVAGIAWAWKHDAWRPKAPVVYFTAKDGVIISVLAHQSLDEADIEVVW